MSVALEFQALHQSVPKSLENTRLQRKILQGTGHAEAHLQPFPPPPPHGGEPSRRWWGDYKGGIR